jgi:hypothetical protein
MKFVNQNQLKLLNRIEQDPNFENTCNCNVLKTNNLRAPKEERLKKLIAIKNPLIFNFESELSKAFKKYEAKNLLG